MIELIVLGMSTKTFWFIMWFMSWFVNWYVMGLVWPDDDAWDDGDMIPLMMIVTALSPAVIVLNIMVVCYRHGKMYKEIRAERQRIKDERVGGMTDEQLDRLGQR